MSNSEYECVRVDLGFRAVGSWGFEMTQLEPAELPSVYVAREEMTN